MPDSYEIKYLLSLVDDDPSNWVVRKETALKLFEADRFLEAANMVWQTPEIPSTDMDVGFAVKMVSRARPNRSIRLVYELWNRNAGKAKQNIALANVFNLIGFPMLAARCYGAAMTLNDGYFDIGFEAEAFLTDDEKVLGSTWSEYRDEDLKQSFSGDYKELVGYPIAFKDLKEELDEDSLKIASEAAVAGDVEDLGAALQKFNTITPMISGTQKSANAQTKLFIPQNVASNHHGRSPEVNETPQSPAPAPAPTMRFITPAVRRDES